MRIFLVLLALSSIQAQAELVYDKCLIINQLFDSRSGKIVEKNQVIAIKAQRIMAIVSTSSRIDCKKTINLKGMTLLPGLIDTHTHLLMLDKTYGTNALDEILRNVNLGVPKRLQAAKPRVYSYLSSGFTTIRELGNSGLFGDIELKKKINSGEFTGPRVIPSGPGFSPMPGQLPEGSDRATVEKEYKVVDKVSEVKNLIISYKEKGVETIKVFADNIPNNASMDEAILNEIVKQSHAMGLRVAAHCAKASSAKAAVAAGVDSIDHGYGIEEATLKKMAKRGIFFAPTLISRSILTAIIEKLRPNNPGNKDRVDQIIGRQIVNFKMALKAGVKIVSGTDMYIELTDVGFSQGEAAKQLLFAFYESGMNAASTLQTSTFNASALLGMTDEIGEIKKGALADIIAVEGNPLNDFSSIDKVKFVMKSGKVIIHK